MRSRKDRIDSNQPEIVEALRKIKGVTVELDKDDILVGYKGRTFWYEIKNPDKVGADGKIRQSALKDSQKKLLKTWTGHYRVVWDVQQILDELKEV